ncbi:MAG: DUF342 domain-containing protein [Chitinivibrionales bacterium]|nr:DUF342 domain-containing protein [Chitinivibrionales bacterium]
MLRKGRPLSKFSILHTPDGLKGYLLVPDVWLVNYPCAEELEQVLNRHGIVFGIKHEILSAMVDKKVCNKRIEVACGKPPQAGEAGRIEMLVDTSASGKPRELENGRVDHKDLSYMVNVTKGTPLIRRIPPQPGVPGASVFGKELQPPPPKEVQFPEGKNLAVDEQDENLLIAACDGALMLYKNGSIEIRDEGCIYGDIDYATGNIEFAGDLRISGTVRSGFCVAVQGSLLVEGGVEDARVSAVGPVEIRGGAQGGDRGMLQSESDIRAKHMQHTSARCKGNISIAEDVVRCRLSAAKHIRARTIVGGIIEAGIGVEAAAIGSEAEAKTEIIVNGPAMLLKQKEDFLKRVTRIVHETGMAKEAAYILVKDGMDEHGLIDDSSNQRLGMLKEKVNRLRQEREQVQHDLETIDEKIAAYPEMYVQAGKLFPGVKVTIAGVEKRIRQVAAHVKCSVDNNEIVVHRP